MNEQELINLKLELAKAWLDNGQEQLARDIIRSVIEKGAGPNE
jgi:FimV-like protein